MGTKHLDACKYSNVCTHLQTYVTDAPPYQQTQFLPAAAAGHQPATSSSLNELWQGVVLFPPPSVFCLPGTLIGSMQSNVTNWIILALELEAADRRSRERRAQSGSHTKNTSLGWHFISFCSGLLWDFTPRPPKGTSGIFSICLGPFGPLADLRPTRRWKGQRALFSPYCILGEYKLQRVMLGTAEELIPGQ